MPQYAGAYLCPCTPPLGCCCRQQSCQCTPTICIGLQFQPYVKNTSWIRTAMEWCPVFAITSQFTVSTKHRSGFFSMRTLPRKMFVNAYSPNSCNRTRSETHHIQVRFCLKTHFMSVQNRTEFWSFHSNCLSCRQPYGWTNGPLCRLWVMTPVAWSLSYEQTISSFRHMEAVVPPKCRYPPVTRLHTQQYNIIFTAV